MSELSDTSPISFTGGCVRMSFDPCATVAVGSVEQLKISQLRAQSMVVCRITVTRVAYLNREQVYRVTLSTVIQSISVFMITTSVAMCASGWGKDHRGSNVTRSNDPTLIENTAIMGIVDSQKLV